MIMTQEQLILKAQQQFEQIEAFVRQACTEGRPLHEVESDLLGRMLTMGRLLLQSYVAGYGQGDLYLGLSISCGCIGSGGDVNGYGTLARAVAILVVGGAAYILEVFAGPTRSPLSTAHGHEHDTASATVGDVVETSVAGGEVV